jgi:hypothetical protein
MTEYLKIIDTNFYEAIKDKGQGVYKIYSLDENGTPIPLNRVLDIDNEGVLYIGTTPKRTLQERLADFKNTVLKKGSSHTAGRRYKKLPALMAKFPTATIAITFQTTDQPVTLEKELLNKYMQAFGEVPPLNSF